MLDMYQQTEMINVSDLLDFIATKGHHVEDVAICARFLAENREDMARNHSEKITDHLLEWAHYLS